MLLLKISASDICDYGMYAEKEHCVACEVGKTTLVQGANSHHHCIGKSEMPPLFKQL
jgi:hypothetical protein